MRFTSQSIQMPTSDRIFPDGPGAEAVNNNCLACHSAGMVLTQPKLTKAQWTETVNKMVHVYKARSIRPTCRPSSTTSRR